MSQISSKDKPSHAKTKPRDLRLMNKIIMGIFMMRKLFHLLMILLAQLITTIELIQCSLPVKMETIK